jgi:hypothetical protein
MPNFKVTHSRHSDKSKHTVWIDNVSSNEEARNKALELGSVRDFLSQDDIYDISIINEQSLIQAKLSEARFRN